MTHSLDRIRLHPREILRLRAELCSGDPARIVAALADAADGQHVALVPDIRRHLAHPQRWIRCAAHRALEQLMPDEPPTISVVTESRLRVSWG
ncbi:MAG: hypothetical protein H6739_34055 [Alphaproteobacteria bacterium]|nr:hypothetical protein [Alphaproteobacteria bacterium]